jgi:hypothetical protein
MRLCFKPRLNGLGGQERFKRMDLFDLLLLPGGAASGINGPFCGADQSRIARFIHARIPYDELLAVYILDQAALRNARPAEIARSPWLDGRTLTRLVGLIGNPDKSKRGFAQIAAFKNVNFIGHVRPSPM